MLRRLATTTVAAALCVAAFHPANADASNVGWSVSIGGPGYAVNVGAPGLWGGGHPAYRGPVVHHPWVRPGIAAPLWLPPAYPVAAYPLPLSYAAPYAVPYATPYATPYAKPYAMPYRVAVAVPRVAPIPVHAHRRAVIVAPALRAPAHRRPTY